MGIGDWKIIIKQRNMKWRQFYAHASYLLLYGCSRALDAKHVEDNIPGKYISQSGFPEPNLREILSITCRSRSGNVYEVTYVVEEFPYKEMERRSPAVMPETWLGYYDRGHRQLVDLGLSKVIAFVPEEQKAFYGRRELLKVMTTAKRQ